MQRSLQKIVVLCIVFAVLAAGFIYLVRKNTGTTGEDAAAIETPTDQVGSNDGSEQEPLSPIEVVAQDLTIPWDIVFLPEGGMLVSERPGRIVHVESGQVFLVHGVEHVGEGGLMGMALHPNFNENRYLYLYQTTARGDRLVNRVVRYIYENDALTYDTIIYDDIPGARYHDGGRIAFGPDGKLYVAVGDATNEPAAQDSANLAGSILRINDDGSIPRDNPFGNAVYSYGHRNPQGLAFDGEGRLWSTEHGRSGVLSGYDELNLILPGANYGWPDSEGDTVAEGTTAPILHSGARDTWASASAVYLDGSIFFGGLRGEALYEAVLRDTEVVELKEHFKNEYKRIRTVVLGPEGHLYFTTSNRDGRGSGPHEGDDIVVRVDPTILP